MIVKSIHSPLIWKTSVNVLPIHIPELVEQVAQEHGKYLIYKNEYINVQAALKHKKLAEDYIFHANKQLSTYESTSDDAEKIMCRNEMIKSVNNAGCYFRLYVRDLNASYQNNVSPEMPVFIETHPDLLKAWQKGYDEIGSQLYEDSN